MDREIWDEFGSNPAEVARLATLIRQGIAAEQQQTSPAQDEADDVEFYEGRLLTQKHMRRERSPGLRKALLKKRQDSGLQCDMCGETHSSLPPDLRAAAFEAHHVIPIASVGEGVTKLSDVALLCAVCHRVLHRMISLRRTWIGVAEARTLLQTPF
ncbi:HNH endonuclease [Brevundimonas sp. TWP2-3-2]|uniref:HNH endonuclease n=1 Tax=unclassified Brevundimonas TaxID=2622653 RepID=UPI003CF146C3